VTILRKWKNGSDRMIRSRLAAAKMFSNCCELAWPGEFTYVPVIVSRDDIELLKVEDELRSRIDGSCDTYWSFITINR
jgi:hypothetical protein